jgi:hypothetical protein
VQKQPYEFTKLIECWQAMPRAAGQAPQKTTFSPVKLSSLMPFLFLLEREENGYLAVRLLGSELEEKFAYAPQGGPQLPDSNIMGGNSVFEAMMHENWQSYDRFMERCGSQVCAGRLARSVRSPDGLIHKIESLQLPLADAEGRARYMLGVMIRRASRERSENTNAALFQAIKMRSEIAAATPKAAILDYEYIDVGHGVPAATAGLDESPVGDAAIAETYKKEAGNDPLTISREFAQAVIN